MNILGKSLTDLKNLISEKKISEQEIFEYFQKRIKKYDEKLKCFITAVNQADRGNRGNRVDLFGLPIAVKDNFCTKGLLTTASSKILEDFVPPYDATVVKKLKDAGYLILGKTNLDAWAHGSSTETSDFFPTKNPYDITRVPGGSSGGSAAAVAAYLTPIAIGSETAGSIRHPASWCGVVGLKPTYGRVSRYGVIAMGSSWDCPGPIAQTVEDAAYLLGIIAGHDPYDATSSRLAVPNYLKGLKNKKKYKIGIADQYFKISDKITVEAVMAQIDELKKEGHEVKKVTLLDPKYAVSVYMILQRAEVASNLGRYDGIRFGKDRSFFGEEAKRRIMLGTYVLSHGYYDQYYKKAQKVREAIKEDFNRVFQEVDFIIAPTTPMTALKLGEFEKYPFFGEAMDILNEPAAAAGIPAISLPVGFDKTGLPIGMQIMGRWFNEENLLNMAYQVEHECNFDMMTILKSYRD